MKAETVIKFKTEGAANAQRDAVKVARAANLTPKQVRSVLRLMGWSTSKIDAVAAAMDKADRKEIVARLKLQGFTDKEIKKVLDGLDKTNKAKAEPKAKLKDEASKPLDAILRKHFELNGMRTSSTHTTHYETTGNPPGPWMGGRVGAWAGQMSLGALARFAAGGKVPGAPPSDPRKDNVLARDELGRALAVRSGEWIINEPASRLNDRLLRAINSGYNAQQALGFNSGGRVPGGGHHAGEPLRVEITGARVTVNGLEGRMENIAANVVEGHESHRASRRRAGGS